MKQELEIEYKNLLTVDEYEQILAAEFINNPSCQNVVQTNHYFDTADHLLRKHQSAARIRIIDTQNELTFKVPAQGFLLESNFHLEDEQAKLILAKKQFSLNDITHEKIDLKIPGLTNHSVFKHFNQFTTLRYEKQIGDHLMILDQTTFQNNLIDHELEVESTSPSAGKNFFDSILKRYAIPSRSTLPKIARAQNNQ